jgi:NADPH:quinone reductase-like Zn-dependent oxidoreductase
MLSARQLGAELIIAMSRHGSRRKLAREFGATDILAERREEGVARIKDLTNGIGADSVLECVGTQESMPQAIQAVRPRCAASWKRSGPGRSSSLTLPLDPVAEGTAQWMRAGRSKRGSIPERRGEGSWTGSLEAMTGTSRHFGKTEERTPTWI